MRIYIILTNKNTYKFLIKVIAGDSNPSSIVDAIVTHTVVMQFSFPLVYIKATVICHVFIRRFILGKQ